MTSGNPFSASGCYRQLTPQAARALMQRLDPELCALRKSLWHKRVLPQMGHEVNVDGHWLCNESGSYFYKHPAYERSGA